MLERLLVYKLQLKVVNWSDFSAPYHSKGLEGVLKLMHVKIVIHTICMCGPLTNVQ